MDSNNCSTSWEVPQWNSTSHTMVLTPLARKSPNWKYLLAREEWDHALQVQDEIHMPQQCLFHSIHPKYTPLDTVWLQTTITGIFTQRISCSTYRSDCMWGKHRGCLEDDPHYTETWVLWVWSMLIQIQKEKNQCSSFRPTPVCVRSFSMQSTKTWSILLPSHARGEVIYSPHRLDSEVIS